MFYFQENSLQVSTTCLQKYEWQDILALLFNFQRQFVNVLFLCCSLPDVSYIFPEFTDGGFVLSLSLFSAFGLSKYSSDSLIVDKSFLTREFSTCTLFRVFSLSLLFQQIKNYFASVLNNKK